MKNFIQNIKYVKMNDFKLSYFIKKISISIHRKQLRSNLNNFDDQTNRKKKKKFNIESHVTSRCLKKKKIICMNQI